MVSHSKSLIVSNQYTKIVSFGLLWFPQPPPWYDFIKSFVNLSFVPIKLPVVVTHCCSHSKTKRNGTSEPILLWDYHRSSINKLRNGNWNKLWWNIITHINTKLFAWVKSVISISGPFWPCTILNALQVVVPRFRNQWTCHSVNKNHKKLCPFIDPCLVLRESMTGNYLRPKYFPRDSLVNSISRRTPWPTLFEHLLPDKDPKRRTMVDKPRIYGRSPTLS